MDTHASCAHVTLSEHMQRSHVSVFGLIVQFALTSKSF